MNDPFAILQDKLRNSVDACLGTVTVQADVLREVLEAHTRQMQEATESIGKLQTVIEQAQAELNEWGHNEECPVEEHDMGCGPASGGGWDCIDNLPQAECEAVKCSCGLDELKSILYQKGLPK
jgi:hypothetical protein